MPRPHLTLPASRGVARRVRRGDAVVVPRVRRQARQGHGVAGARGARRVQVERGRRDPVVDTGRRRLVGRPADRGPRARPAARDGGHDWRSRVGRDRHLEGARRQTGDRVGGGVASGISGGDAVVVRRPRSQARQTHRVRRPCRASGVLRQGGCGGPVVDAVVADSSVVHVIVADVPVLVAATAVTTGAVASTAAGTWKVRGAEPVPGRWWSCQQRRPR